ncbi:MAG TPA: hypothetical protein VG033_07825 [Candidatus Acidoferrales bacterium]|jgi:hypothetical protein|nr:hypothetical protein [Candidatus Acidoferrales bacterium]
MNRILRQRSVQLAAAFWLVSFCAIFPLSHGTLPFHRPSLADAPFLKQVLQLPIVLVFVFLFLGVIYLVTRRRTPPDMAARAPDVPTAWRETLGLLVYAAVVLGLGQLVGRHFGGEGIGLHLNGSIFGPTRTLAPGEVYLWAAYNFVLLAALPYIFFRMRGYSHTALNLKSANIKNDALLILVVLALESAADLSMSGFLSLSPRQMILGGSLSFLLHLFGTGLPVMIFIYSILLPRYARLSGSLVTTTILGAFSYAAIHIFEYWTVYDSPAHSALSLIFIFLTFFSPGLVKSFLTVRTGNAWVHLWGYHAIAPHVTMDTPVIVRIFGIR